VIDLTEIKKTAEAFCRNTHGRKLPYELDGGDTVSCSEIPILWSVTLDPTEGQATMLSRFCKIDAIYTPSSKVEHVPQDTGSNRPTHL
jgi:hypothetical protein